VPRSAAAVKTRQIVLDCSLLCRICMHVLLEVPLHWRLPLVLLLPY
jgi:hypothetical protein